MGTQRGPAARKSLRNRPGITSRSSRDRGALWQGLTTLTPGGPKVSCAQAGRRPSVRPRAGSGDPRPARVRCGRNREVIPGLFLNHGNHGTTRKNTPRFSPSVSLRAFRGSSTAGLVPIHDVSSTVGRLGVSHARARVDGASRNGSENLRRRSPGGRALVLDPSVSGVCGNRLELRGSETDRVDRELRSCPIPCQDPGSLRADHPATMRADQQ